MKNTTLTSLALLAGSTLASKPTPVLAPRANTSICGQWDSVQTGVYTIYQDLWNEDAGTGSQCTTVDSLSSSDTLSWSTSWSWSGGTSSVKSFANAVANTTVVTLASISSIPSVWQWSYSGTDIVADVAYDMFTSSSASGDDEYEIMVWLDALGGAGPISSTGSAIATPTINGVSWSLYYGLNGEMKVYSFVAGTAQEDFSGDMMEFFAYLISDQGMPDSQYLLSVGAGSEPFTGSDAVFSVSAYSLAVETGSGSVASSTTSAAAATVTGKSSKTATTTKATGTSVAAGSEMAKATTLVTSSKVKSSATASASKSVSKVSSAPALASASSSSCKKRVVTVTA